MADLKEYGVVHGIKKDIIERMALEQVCDERILIAEGTLPEPGVDGRFEILIDTSGIGKPKRREDGSVDHKELKKVINVKKGQPLIRRIPPQPGKKGRSILGKDIDPPKSKDAVLSPSLGTEILEENPDLLVAATDGAVSLNTAGGMEVRTAKVINGDIDYSTGNISFSGDLKITGGVRAGFSIKADGNLTISGHVEDTEVSSSGDMEITGGAVGSNNGKLIIGGSLKVHHLENFTVQARKSIMVIDSILHSSIRTEALVKAKTIVGGQIEAAHGIEAGTIGSASETKTVIKIGNVFFLLQQRKMVNEKQQEIRGGLIKCKEEIFTLVKNDMDSNGKLGHEDEPKLEELKECVHKLNKQLSKLVHRLEEIEIKLKDNPNPVIKANVVFPNTVIRFGLVEKIIKEKIFKKIICADENKIIIRNE